MRKLVQKSQPYVISTEWGRLHPDSTLAPPTVWWIRLLSGAEVFQWRYTAEAEDADRSGMSAAQRASKKREIDTDMLRAAVEKIVDYEGEDGKPYDITDERGIREAIDGLEVREREELARVVQSQAALTVGEPSRLRSLLTSLSGEDRARPVSATGNADPARAEGSIEPENVSSTASE